MHPQTFLKTFWRMELRPQVFVAMSFAPQYQRRFDEVIAPAVRELTVNGVRLKPQRVDISKSGDSILTDISDGIAHSRLVLADVSSIGTDSVTGERYRNGNVMYEVGLALSCRHPTDVLLVRDDRDRFLFDVSTIPHATIQFADVEKAKMTLKGILLARLKMQSFVRDARVQLAISSLSGEEVVLLKQMKEYDQNSVWGREVKGIANWYALATARLLDKEVIRVMGEFSGDKTAFAFTPLGFIVQKAVNARLRKFQAKEKAENDDSPESIENDASGAHDTGGSG